MPKPAASVDDFLATLDHPHKDAILALRAICRGAAEGLTEQVKWNAPSYGFAGEDRVTMRLQPPGKLSLILHRGAKPKDATGFAFDDPDGLIAWAAPDRGVVAVADLADVTARRAAIAAVVARWLAATRA